MTAIAEHSENLRLMRELLKEIRKAAPKRDHTWTEPVDWLLKRVWLNGRTVNVLNIWLTPTGCEWASRGGCTMCGEWSGSEMGNCLPGEYHVAQFAKAIVEYVPKYESPWVRIYQEGSFLNPNEVDPVAQHTIVRLASLVQGIERVTIEARTQYVTEEVTRDLADALARSVELEIGIGLEAKDEVVRNVCVNKGEPLSSYERAVEAAQHERLRTLAYVLVKPPFLTEKEALDEAINTAHFAFELGFDAVSIEPVSVHEWSLAGLLYFHGLYAPPWLWTVLEVARQTCQAGELRIGGVEYYPRPEMIAHNRHEAGDEDCNARCWAMIRRYNETHDCAVLQGFEHSCIDKWREEMMVTLPPLKVRISEILARISIKDYLEFKSASAGSGIWSKSTLDSGESV